MRAAYPYWLGNRPIEANRDLAVADKYFGTVVTQVALADAQVLDAAIDEAVRARESLRRMPADARQAVLHHCARRLAERAEELAAVLCAEAGKPLRDARAEVGRSIDTFRFAAEEATRIRGEVLPFDVTPRSRGYSGMWKRLPVGACAFITPFNFPLNLVAHKVAPAIAIGCPFVLKPASLTPVSALLLGEVLAETELPHGAFSILPCRPADAERLASDDRLALLSFTGSPEVGWALKARAGRKKVVLELGGNAAVVLDETWPDLDDAVARIVTGAFAQSGQSCISVQRIFVHEAIYDTVRARLEAAVRGLAVGDPRAEQTVVGPLIAESEAIRLEQWIASAVARGGRLICGGGRRGALLEPALLEDVPPEEPLVCREAFGPVAVLFRFSDFAAALAAVNDSPYGLQAGVFTRDLYRMYRAWDTLEVGGVLIGEVPTWRADHMPYGGVKASGCGREGVRFAIEEMSEIRLLAVRHPGGEP